MNSQSPFWPDHRNPADNVSAGYSPPSLYHDISTADILHRSHSQPSFAAEECRLLHPQPGLVHRTPFITGQEGWPRHPSPSRSPSSLNRSPTVSTTVSERHDTPRFSPEVVDRLHARACSLLHEDVDIAFASGGFGHASSYDSLPHIDCVAMDEVQTIADSLPEGPSYDSYPYGDDTSSFGNQYAYTYDDGFVTMDQSTGGDDTSATCCSTPNSEDAYQTRATSRHVSEEHQQQQQRPRIRHRRTTSSATVVSNSTAPPGRVSKRPLNRRASSYRSVKSDAEESYSDPNMKSQTKTFPCLFGVYGCPSTFGNKNEWKRHMQTQHMLLEHWHCEQCEDVNKVNDFNRRDLFIQHVVRMHPFTSTPSTTTKKSKKYAARGPPRSPAEQQYLDNEATRCHRQLRQPPETTRCVICGQVFEGSGTWEHRLEHIGRHFEENNKRNRNNTATAAAAAAPDHRNWHVDLDLQQYLLDKGIVIARGNRLVLADEK